MTTTTLLGLSKSRPNSARFRASFHFMMAVLMAMVVIYGFSQTIAAKLIHPLNPRPAVLYAHAIIFSAWIALYVLNNSMACHAGRLRQ